MTYIAAPTRISLSPTSDPRQSARLQPFKPHTQTPWWVVVTTGTPICTYYFGPFDSREEARVARPGYVEDLSLEKAGDISALVKQCYPQELTID